MQFLQKVYDFYAWFFSHRGVQDSLRDVESPQHECPPTSVPPQSAPYPLTWNEIESKIREYIALIDEKGVVSLASQYNGNKYCDIFRRENGDFNICYFVHFPGDDIRWVVRIPIVPVIQDCQLKIESEVVTMLYVRKRTSIPIPQVHAYGESTVLIKGSTTPFMIIDCIPGRPLDRNIYLNATEEQRRRLFQDLVKIMSELRRLEFPAAGSLLAKAGDVCSPIVGSALSISANELQRYGKGYGDAGPFSTATQYIAYRYRVLSETYQLPTADASLDSIMSELFASDSVSEQITKLLDPHWDHGPFVLAHQVLRHDNIIIDEDDFRIRGVEDWEFTGTVPRQLFTPPPWITGHDCAGIDENKQELLRSHFYLQLEAASRTHIHSARLKEDWDTQRDDTLAVAQILRRPSTLKHVYYKFIFSTLFDADAKQVISEARQRESFSIEAGNRLEESKRYTKYLSDRGLLDEQDPRITAFLEQAAALRKRVDALR